MGFAALCPFDDVMVAGTGRLHLGRRPLVQVVAVACIMPETFAHARRRESHRVAWLRNGGALARDYGHRPKLLAEASGKSTGPSRFG